MSSKHCSWLTVEEWHGKNLPLSTPSNEASKMFDASLLQFVGYWEDESIGGLSTCLRRMLQADPDFVMGYVLTNSLQLYGGGVSIHNNPDLEKSVSRMLTLCDKQASLSAREKKHAKAVSLLADGYMIEACNVWEDILLEHPLDVLALKCAYLGYIYLGDSVQLRDSVARVLSHWDTNCPYYGFLLGMHAFGLEETNLYERAEKQARKALEINRHDCWSTHTLSHVLEMTGRQDEGISFLKSTVADWEGGKSLACHNYWHLALHHIEKGQYDQALEVFDSQVAVRTNRQKELFNIQDSCSLLLRLEMEGVDVGSRWEKIFEICWPHLHDHILAFNEPHLLMGCLGAGKLDVAHKMMESIEGFVKSGSSSARDAMASVGQSVCQALVAFKAGDFASVVNLLYPIRYRISAIGGSHAQRDVFNLLLVQAAMRSPYTEHHRIARAMLAERKSLKENSPLTDRLLANLVAMHSG